MDPVICNELPLHRVNNVIEFVHLVCTHPIIIATPLRETELYTVSKKQY